MVKMPNKSHIFLFAVYGTLLIFTSISIYYITLFHVSPLSRDQWHMYAPYFEHGLLQAALTPMSTHRHIFPFFIFDIDMSYFGGRNHFLIFFGSFFNGLTILLLALALKADNALTRFEKHAFFILIVTLSVWLINIAQLGWGFMSTQYYLAIFSYLFAIFTAYQYFHSEEAHRSPTWLVISLTSGVICTFSFGIGILVWPALLYFLYLWRCPIKFYFLFTLSLVFSLIVFFLLPGGETIKQALLFSPMNTITFLFELAGGPAYYLLRSFRFLDIESVKLLASWVGVIASSTGIFILILLLKKRSKLSLFSTLCCSLMLLGLGTPALISFTRNPFFLDVWVDRYQIWATLFWLGCIPLFCQQFHRSLDSNFTKLTLIKTFVLVFICFLPLFAMPSQLDMGARLSEYKIRVQQALLAYQVGIPDKRAAEEALHWDWETKLAPFFTVLNHIKTQKKNIYYIDYTDYLGKSIIDLGIKEQANITSLDIKKIRLIKRNDLLDLKTVPSSSEFTSFKTMQSSDVVGYEINAYISTKHPWSYALTTNEFGIVNGLAIAIKHSQLPRSQLKYINTNYNVFAIVRNDGAQKIRFYFFDEGDLTKAQISEEIKISANNKY